MRRTYPHAQDADGRTPNQPPGISHASAKEIGPTKLGEHGGEDVAESDYALRRGRRDQVKCGREDDDIEHCFTLEYHPKAAAYLAHRY